MIHIVCKPSLASAAQVAVTGNVLQFLRLCPSEHAVLPFRLPLTASSLSCSQHSYIQTQFPRMLFFLNRSHTFRFPYTSQNILLKVDILDNVVATLDSNLSSQVSLLV